MSLICCREDPEEDEEKPEYSFRSLTKEECLRGRTPERLTVSDSRIQMTRPYAVVSFFVPGSRPQKPGPPICFFVCPCVCCIPVGSVFVRKVIFLMSVRSLFIAAMLCSAIFASSALAAEKPEKKALLITSFGTSMPEARRSIDALVEAARKAFPDRDVRLSFTSNIIRRKLKREGMKDVPPTPVSALAALNDEGYASVGVMPTHVIPGAEYDEIRNVVEAWRELKGKYAIKDLRLGRTFLSSVEACDEMAGILLKRFADVPQDCAVVLMGHGTPHHIANAMYSQLQVSLDKAADGRFFIGTVENTPLLEDVIAGLKKAGLRKVLLSPLMIVAGDHARNDMAGKDDPESWLNVLLKEGFSVETRVEGLGEDPGITAAFTEHIAEMLK